jgi:hypothetical protein
MVYVVHWKALQDTHLARQDSEIQGQRMVPCVASELANESFQNLHTNIHVRAYWLSKVLIYCHMFELGLN